MAVARALGRWTHVARPEPETPHELVFTVKQKNIDKIHDLLMTRSNPKSASYGKWLSPNAVRQLTRNDDALRAVKNALKDIGATVVNTTLGGEMVRARAPIKTWETLLNTEFRTYESKRYQSRHVAAEAFDMPSHLLDHVSGVLGCLELPVGRPLRAKTSQAGSVTPDVIRKAYNMPQVASKGSDEAMNRANVTQAVFASLNQWWSPSDRKQFQELYNLPVRPVKELDNGTHSSDTKCRSSPNDCGEANLDVQYMLAMSPWSQMGLWYLDGGSSLFTDFLETLQNAANPPEVVSISYGGFEVQHSSTEIDTFDELAMKLGLMGVTLIASSGDDGAQGGLWSDKDAGCSDTMKYGLQVNWPASSPYVTALGATEGIQSGTESTCQVHCSGGVQNQECAFDVTGPLITSGGGISGKILTPDWQKGHNPCSRRGIPDVSLAGHSYNVIIGGEEQSVDGTSASAPAFGGIISLVNARRKAAGKSSVGFINQAMYQDTSGFNDITEGDNKCGGYGSVNRNTGAIPCCGGYDAQVGWDAATGLGTINFPKFEKIFDGVLPPVPPSPPTPPTPPVPPTPPAPSSGGYEKPPCASGESPLRIGSGYEVCAPPCDGDSCPPAPSGATATASCGLETSTGEKFCALICTSDGSCPSAARCVYLDQQPVGVCLYSAFTATHNSTMAKFMISKEVTV
jgi:tripeptidyl-peptidase-1